MILNVGIYVTTIKLVLVLNCVVDALYIFCKASVKYELNQALPQNPLINKLNKRKNFLS